MVAQHNAPGYSRRGPTPREAEPNWPVIIAVIVASVVALLVVRYAWSYFGTKAAIDALGNRAPAAVGSTTDPSPSTASTSSAAGQGTNLAEGATATDPTGDAALHGADLTGFSWRRQGPDLQFTVSYAGPFDQMHNLHMYLRTRSEPTGADCPGFDNAQYSVNVVINQAWLESVGPQCPNRSKIADVAAQPTNDGWFITVPTSDLGLVNGGQVAVALLSATDVGGGSETTIQDYLPNEGSPPITFTVPAG